MSNVNNEQSKISLTVNGSLEVLSMLTSFLGSATINISDNVKVISCHVKTLDYDVTHLPPEPPPLPDPEPTSAIPRLDIIYNAPLLLLARLVTGILDSIALNWFEFNISKWRCVCGFSSSNLRNTRAQLLCLLLTS